MESTFYASKYTFKILFDSRALDCLVSQKFVDTENFAIFVLNSPWFVGIPTRGDVSLNEMVCGYKFNRRTYVIIW